MTIAAAGSGAVQCHAGPRWARQRATVVFIHAGAVSAFSNRAAGARGHRRRTHHVHGYFLPFGVACVPAHGAAGPARLDNTPSAVTDEAARGGAQDLGGDAGHSGTGRSASLASMLSVCSLLPRARTRHRSSSRRRARRAIVQIGIGTCSRRPRWRRRS